MYAPPSRRRKKHIDDDGVDEWTIRARATNVDPPLKCLHPPTHVQEKKREQNCKRRHHHSQSTATAVGRSVANVTKLIHRRVPWEPWESNKMKTTTTATTTTTSPFVVIAFTNKKGKKRTRNKREELKQWDDDLSLHLIDSADIANGSRCTAVSPIDRLVSAIYCCDLYCDLFTFPFFFKLTVVFHYVALSIGQ